MGRPFWAEGSGGRRKWGPRLLSRDGELSLEGGGGRMARGREKTFKGFLPPECGEK